MDIAAIVVSILGSNGILLFLVKWYFTQRDQAQAQKEKANQELLKKVNDGLETLRLLSYARMSEETERLLSQGYATPAERRTLDAMYQNYKSWGWNGDMDSRMEKVYHLRTDHA